MPEMVNVPSPMYKELLDRERTSVTAVTPAEGKAFMFLGTFVVGFEVAVAKITARA